MSLPGLYTHLLATATITALVGTRIFNLVMPQNARYPAIVLQQISGVRVGAMGPVGGPGWAHPRIQITSWATTVSSARAVANAVRIATDAFKGTMGTDTVIGTILQDENDLIDHDAKSSREYYGIVQDYEIWHNEATS